LHAYIHISFSFLACQSSKTAFIVGQILNPKTAVIVGRREYLRIKTSWELPYSQLQTNFELGFFSLVWSFEMNREKLMDYRGGKQIDFVKFQGVVFGCCKNNSGLCRIFTCSSHDKL